jgi:hypothetical protein
MPTSAVAFLRTGVTAGTAGVLSILPDAGTAQTDLPGFGIASDVNASVVKVINSAVPPAAGTNPSYAAHPSSNHPGGVVAAMCDGRTSFVKDSIARHVYAQIMTSDSRWQPAGTGIRAIHATSDGTDGAYTTNTLRVEGWLRTASQTPYLLKDGDL